MKAAIKPRISNEIITESPDLKKAVYDAVMRFVQWLDTYGEFSQDPYDLWATKVGQRAKAAYYNTRLWGSLVVLPFVICDVAFPALRKLVRPRSRSPIGDAHFAMGFAYLFLVTQNHIFYKKARHFLDELIQSRCPGYGAGWGYPFDWVGNTGTTVRFTPLVTTIPYVYEAFATVHDIDRDEKWLEIMHLIAEHVAHDYADSQFGTYGSACSYVPSSNLPNNNGKHVVNASSYRAFLLTAAAIQFNCDLYMKIAEENLKFVLDQQESNGSWFYAAGDEEKFIDNLHTCFVLKNLIKIEQLTQDSKLTNAISRGVEFYSQQLLDRSNLPRPFAKAPRLITYRRSLYDYAESINLAGLLNRDQSKFGSLLDAALIDLIRRWQTRSGSFRTFEMVLGWNNIPYHRWGQSQIFRSLSLYLLMEDS